MVVVKQLRALKGPYFERWAQGYAASVCELADVFRPGKQDDRNYIE